MDSENSPHDDMDVSIIDKDESSDKAYHVVDGFVIEDSKRPFPVSSHCIMGLWVKYRVFFNNQLIEYFVFIEADLVFSGFFFGSLICVVFGSYL